MSLKAPSAIGTLISSFAGTDDEITEDEFNEALRRSRKETAPGPDTVRFPVIKNLTEDRTELNANYQESFNNVTKATYPKTGLFRETYVKKPGKYHRKLNGCRILTIQSTIGKLMKRIVAGCSPGRIPEERAHAGCANRSRGRIQQGPVQAANGPARAIWSQPDTDPVDCRSAPGKNSGDAAGQLELCYSSAHNGPTTRLTTLASPLQCVHQGPGRSEPKWAQSGTRTDGGLVYKTTRDTPEATEAVQQQMDNASQLFQDTGSFINPDKAYTLWCSFDNGAAGKAMPAVIFDGAVIERINHLRYIPPGPLRHNEINVGFVCPL